jgi:hypothetical protein
MKIWTLEILRQLCTGCRIVNSREAFVNMLAPSYLSACACCWARIHVSSVSFLPSKTIFRILARSSGAFTHQTLGEATAGRLW